MSGLKIPDEELVDARKEGLTDNQLKAMMDRMKSEMTKLFGDGGCMPK